MRYLYLFTFLLLLSSSYAQQRIDGNFSFQTDPSKKYSLYIPSTYNVNAPNKLMLGLHPLNTNRWNAKSWCDTLVQFAEQNKLILVCPDGGIDGRIDDAIDTAFTSALLDSVEVWYKIDTSKVYAMGFSWGGRTTYTYGLNHHRRIKGFIPIGAAINGAGSLSSIIQNAKGKPWYVLHGANDSPAIRYTPLINALQQNGAILNQKLMPGVGHTIDFPNRNNILTEAYKWVDSVNCANIKNSTGLYQLPNRRQINVFPNPIKSSEQLVIDFGESVGSNLEIEVLDVLGKKVPVEFSKKTESSFLLETTLPQKGLYLIRVCLEGKCEVFRLIQG